jgi:SAM-dependent methyltransferase
MPETEAQGERDAPYQQGVLGHGAEGEFHRLRLLERVCDPVSRDIIAGTGLAPDWRCAELGAGAGSMARWLAEQCPDGRVVATDLDTGFLQSMRLPGHVEVLRHDVCADPGFDIGSFDLIHARALLTHLPDPEGVLRNLTGWLAPGGWLVLEDPAYLLTGTSPYPDFAALLSACEKLLAKSQGTDGSWARRMPAAMARRGLTDIQMSARTAVCGLGDAEEEFWRRCFDRAAPALVASGLIGAERLRRALSHLDDPSFTEATWTFISCRGRLPA